MKPVRSSITVAAVAAILATTAVPLSGDALDSSTPAPTGQSSRSSTFHYITAVSPNGRYFVDQAGAPIAMFEDHQWNLIARGGEWDETGAGTTPLSVFQGYAATQAANGFNAVEVLAIDSNQGGAAGPFQDGRTWDGLTPWVGGAIGVLNNAYWSRVDNFIDAMAAQGITVVLNLVASYNSAGGTAFAGLNATNGATYGAAIGNRYRDKPNIIYQFGVDDFGFADVNYAAIANAIQATGDTHLITEQNMAESNTRTDSSDTAVGTFGTSTDAAYDEVYSYNATYVEVERAYRLSSPSVRPTFMANGYYDQGGTSGTPTGTCWPT